MPFTVVNVWLKIKINILQIYREVYRDLLTGPPWQQTDMIVAVYDVTKEETFEKVTKVTYHNNHKLFYNKHFNNDRCSALII